MSTKFLSPGWRMPKNANQSKQSNYSMDFDGSNDYIDSGVNIIGNQLRSLSCWYKTTTAGRVVMGLGNTNVNNQMFAISIFLSNQINIFGKGGANDVSMTGFTTDLISGNWTHIVVTWDGSDLKAYINGSLESTASRSFAYNTTPNLRIGGWGNTSTPGNPFNGQIDAVAVFDYALSSSQVATLYGTGSAIGNPMALPSPPIAYYPLGTSAYNGEYLAENNAIGDYVFNGGAHSSFVFNSNINQANTGGKFTVSFWAKNATNQQVSFSHGGSYVGAFEQAIGQMIVWLAGSVYQYFSYPTSDPRTDGKWHHYVVYVDTNTVTDSEVWIDKVKMTKGSGSSGTINAFTSGFIFKPFLGDVSNMMYFINYEIDQANVDKLYNYGSPLMSTVTLTQAPNAWYKLDATEIYNNSTTEWSVDNNANTSTYDTSINLVKASSQKIDIANGSELDFTGDFTMSIWVNLTTSSNNMGVFNKTSQANNNGVSLFKRGGADFEFYVSEYSNVLTFASQGDNIWQQITITLNRTTGERIAYINGEQAATLTHIKTFTFPNQGWDIGTFTNNSPNYLDAKVSNFKLFNTVLSPTEVQTLYNNGTPLTDMSSFTSLKGWWKLNNLSSGLTDSSSNSNTATVTSGTNEYTGFVNALAGDSSGMTQANLIQSDLQTVAPYSKYAMNFDGTNEKMTFNSSPIDLGLSSTETWWIKYSNTSSNSASIASAPVTAGFHILYERSTNKVYYRIDTTNLYYEWVIPSTYFSDNLWHHYAIVRDDSLPFSSYIKLYIDGNLFGSPTAINATSKSTTNTKITDWGGASAYTGIVADFSNIAFWNTALTASEAREIYNEGLPTNLNTFSGTAPVVWWQMGSNSSFDGSDWICADEIGSNNGATSNIGEESLVNGVGTTANGLSSGMSEGNLVGDAPYSTANALSTNMIVTSRVLDVAPSPPDLLLDTYTGSAAAYSLRRLSNSYTGNLIRVTKKVSTVISTTDIGYNSSNELDTTALAAFASGADNGEVKVDIWYDQSGNSNNVTHGTYSQLPKIYESGSLITENSKPALSVSRDRLITTGTPISSQQSSIFYVTKVLSGNNSYDRLFAIGTSSSGYFTQIAAVGTPQTISSFYNGQVSNGGDLNSQRLITFYNDSTTQYLRQDSVQIDSDSKTPSSYGSKDISLFSDTNIGKGFVGIFQEFIFYPSEQSSNLTGIETNIKNYHGI